MKFLASSWGLAILGLLLNVGTTIALLLPAIGTLVQPEIGPPEKTALPPRMWSFKTEAVEQLIAELKTEREKLEGERKGVVGLQGQVAAERAELDKVRADIKAMQDEIDQRVVQIEEQEMKNLKSLAQTYSAMNPPAAVPIFREMDENMVVKVLSFMKSDRIGPILGEMGKAPEKPGTESLAKRAARISDKLRLLKPLEKKPTP